MTQIQLRRDTAANWAASSSVLALGEPGYDYTNKILKIGDGSSLWPALPNAGGANLTPTATKTANYNANALELVRCNASGGTFTVFLPADPLNGTQVGVKTDVAGSVTIQTSGTNTFNTAGGTTTQTCELTNQVNVYMFYGGVWYQVSQALPLAQQDARYLRADTTAQTIQGKTMDAGSNTLTGIAWCPEMVINSSAIADGYNDMPGGISVEPGPKASGISLDSVWVRLGLIGSTVSGGSCAFAIYAGDATNLGTLVSTVTLAAGDTNQIGVLGSPYDIAANTVFRCYVTKGSSTIVSPVHVQLRGRYKG